MAPDAGTTTQGENVPALSMTLMGSFHGGIDIIKTLPKGTPGDVQNEVKTRIQQLGSNGGYIMASSHHMQADTPLENVRAMYDLAIR